MNNLPDILTLTFYSIHYGIFKARWYKVQNNQDMNATWNIGNKIIQKSIK